MSLRITSVGRSLDDVVPLVLDPTAPAVSFSNIQNDTTTVNLTTEGTIDWWWFGTQTASNIPQDITFSNLHMKRFGMGWLWEGFRWRFGGGTVSTLSQTSSRSMTATAADNMMSSNAINSNQRTGYQTATTGLGGFGFQLCLPVSEVTRRLRVFTIQWVFDMRIDALVISPDGTSASATDLITTGVGAFKYSIIQVDFSGPSNGGQFILNAYVEFQHQADANFQLQAMTLSEP